ncbi:MAG TPA: HlyD family efflux transporter periplasmic adaptor subunit [Flavobacteriales bacterium]|nr:HlyD family efflux transporter periplasmic adaptor subunit [Flavobacteriales bacterium]
MVNRKNLLIAGGVLALILVIWSFSGSDKKSGSSITVRVERGLFEVTVFTTGELEAMNSVDIKGPAGLRAANIWRVRIADLIPEGTKVKKGDFIASLDKSEISGKLSEAYSRQAEAESKFTQVKIDTTLELRQDREEMINLRYDLKEKMITLEQSKYEPPATISKAEIELEKSERALNEKIKNYKIKVTRAAAKMSEEAAALSRARNKYELLSEVLDGFNITAPEDGMVIYEREWNGKKKTTGSEIGAWDPTVATLPDLSAMISKTYVNEVDIRKISVDQIVKVSLDAFPDKSLTGKVIEVANVGEQLPNTDSKVFEVKIEIIESDTNLRPGMTTGNNVIANTIDSALIIPLECIHSEDDTIVYVFKQVRWRLLKQEVEVGDRNDNHATILNGLKEDDEVLLTIPSNADDLKVERLTEVAKSN